MEFMKAHAAHMPNTTNSTLKILFIGGKMKIKVIKTDAELDAAVDRLEALAMKNPEPSGEIADEMELLSLVIADYENKHYPIAKPTPVEAIQFIMEQRGLKVKDIAPCFGSTARAYAVLSGSRNLSLNMIRRLHQTFHIPAETLIRCPSTKPRVPVMSGGM